MLNLESQYWKDYTPSSVSDRGATRATPDLTILDNQEFLFNVFFP